MLADREPNPTPTVQTMAMTTPTPTPPLWRSLVRRFVIPLGAMIIAFAAGWTVGGGRTAGTDWTDAAVTVTGTQASIKVDDASFKVGQVVPGWLDADGTWQENSWPSCLKDGFSGTLPVLVSDTTVDGTSIKTVVAVDCS